MNYSIPVSATIYPPNYGPALEAYQNQSVAEIRKEVDSANSAAAANFSTACANWANANLHNRDMGLPLTAKPTAPNARALHVDYVRNGDVIQYVDDDGNPLGSPFAMALATPELATVFVWDAADGLAVGPPCPDLPALPSRGPGHVHVGVRLGRSEYFNKPPDDTIAIGGVPVQATSDDGVSGMFLGIAPIFSTTQYNPYSGYYLKVG